MNLNSSMEICAVKNEAIQIEAELTGGGFGAPASLVAVLDGKLR